MNAAPSALGQGQRRWRPAPGRRVLKPGGDPVSDAGEPLPATPYFARLIADGDLVPSPRPAKRPAMSRSKPA